MFYIVVFNGFVGIVLKSVFDKFFSFLMVKVVYLDLVYYV